VGPRDWAITSCPSATALDDTIYLPSLFSARVLGIVSTGAAAEVLSVDILDERFVLVRGRSELTGEDELKRYCALAYDNLKYTLEMGMGGGLPPGLPAVTGMGVDLAGRAWFLADDLPPLFHSMPGEEILWDDIARSLDKGDAPRGAPGRPLGRLEWTILGASFLALKEFAEGCLDLLTVTDEAGLCFSRGLPGPFIDLQVRRAVETYNDGRNREAMQLFTLAMVTARNQQVPDFERIKYIGKLMEEARGGVFRLSLDQFDTLRSRIEGYLRLKKVEEAMAALLEAGGAAGDPGFVKLAGEVFGAAVDQENVKTASEAFALLSHLDKQSCAPWLEMLAMLLELEDYPAFDRLMERGVERFPAEADLFRLAASGRLRRGQLIEAWGAIEEAHRLERDNLDILIDRLKIAAEIRRRPDRFAAGSGPGALPAAVTDLEKLAETALAGHPGNIEITAMLAETALDCGDIGRAWSMYETIAEQRHDLSSRRRQWLIRFGMKIAGKRGGELPPGRPETVFGGEWNEFFEAVRKAASREVKR
jgi:hypothetical protein